MVNGLWWKDIHKSSAILQKPKHCGAVFIYAFEKP